MLSASPNAMKMPAHMFMAKALTSDIAPRINPKYNAFSAGKILLLGMGLSFVLSIIHQCLCHYSLSAYLQKQNQLLRLLLQDPMLTEILEYDTNSMQSRLLLLQ